MSDRVMPRNTENRARNQYWIPITLWSRLKIYFRMNPVGAWCAVCAAAWDDIDIRVLLLLSELVLLPLFEIGFGHHFERAAHLAVAEAAELGAGDLICSDYIGLEMKGDLHARNDVLLQAQFA